MLCHLSLPGFLLFLLLLELLLFLFLILFFLLRFCQSLLDPVFELSLELPLEFFNSCSSKQPHVSLSPNKASPEHIYFQLLSGVLSKCDEFVPSPGKKLVSIKEVPSPPLFNDSKTSLFEFEKVLGEEVVFLLYFSHPLPVLHQLSTNLFFIGNTLNIVFPLHDFVFDCFTIQELRLNSVATPGVETDGHTSALEGGNLLPLP